MRRAALSRRPPILRGVFASQIRADHAVKPLTNVSRRSYEGEEGRIIIVQNGTTHLQITGARRNYRRRRGGRYVTNKRINWGKEHPSGPWRLGGWLRLGGSI